MWDRRKILILALALIMAVFTFGCGGSNDAPPAAGGGEAEQKKPANNGDDKVYVMKFSHASSTEGSRHATVATFKEKLEAATNGRIKVEIYPNSQLGNNVSVMQGLQVGTIEAQIAPTAYMSGFEELFTVIDLPYLWPSMDVALDILNNSNVAASMVEGGNEKGIYTAAFWGVGEKNVITTFPVNKPEDLQGQKIRVMDDQLLIEQFRSWGATAVPIAYGELYNSLQQGIVEGYENVLDNWYEMKFYEVAKNFTFSKHGLMIDGVFISKPWYDSLPGDLQKMVTEIAKESVFDRQEHVRIAQEEAVEWLEAEAPDVIFHEISDEVRQSFADKIQGVHEIFASRSATHKKCLDEFKQLIKNR